MNEHDLVGGAVGIELCSNLIRGVHVIDPSAGIAHAAEVALIAYDDDVSMLDAMMRLRADLGSATVPARIATFPAGSWMRRLDVTGKSGPELNTLRAEIDRRYRAASTLLIDQGPRRWLLIIHWPDAGIRRVEALAERAGFIDVAVEPSPVALARAVGRDITLATRYANVDEAAATLVDDRVPVAAVSIDGTGHAHPDLLLGRPSYSPALFDDVVEGDAAAELIDAIRLQADPRRSDSESGDDPSGHQLHLAGDILPSFPPHDLRATERQCVAIGAAIGASGLIGLTRPVDIITDAPAQTPLHRRPWAVERLPTVEQTVSTGPNAARRTLARMTPRRRR